MTDQTSSRPVSAEPFMPIPDTLPDAQQVRARYRAERDKRLASNREDIPELTGDLARYLQDPHTPAQTRTAVYDEVEALVIGGGFGGLMAAARFKEAGLRRVRIVERAGDVGGVWYWNRYPGVMCDVESLIYLPLLEETGYVPRDKYASGSEIFEYTQLIARRFDLYPLALFQTAVTGMAWDEGLSRWVVRTDRGDRILAKYVAVCNGVFSVPKLPAIPGLQSFKGKSFHTSRWDYAYTGGSMSGGLTGLADQRVGIFGTGATAVQVVPHVGRDARATYVFQRTPSTVAPRNNKAVAPAFVAGLTPGWQHRRMVNFTEIISGRPQPEDLVQDGWTAFYGPLRRSLDSFGSTREEALAAKEQLDLRQMEAIRARIDAEVQDRATAELLKPYYPYHCKRPTFHDEYLPAFNLPGVQLVDTSVQGIERIEPDGVVVAGQKIQLDCLIFATGFEFEASIADKGFEILGRQGLSLAEKWRQGVKTLHGMTSHGFPNLFIMPGANAQAALTVNFSHLLQEFALHMAHIVEVTESRGAECFELGEAAEAEWVARIVAGADRSALDICTPGRNTNEGKLDERPLASSNFAGPAMVFFGLLEAWREKADLPGMSLHGARLPEVEAVAGG